MKFLFTFTIAIFLLSYFLGASTGKSVSAQKTTDPINVNGRLDETIWQKTQPISNFMQYEPHKGAPASFQTEVRVLYNNKYIYFGITCFDSQPQKIVSRVSKREGELTSDDSTAIALDTFNDRQTAYIFFTNLNGIQKDGRLAETDEPMTIPGTVNGSLQVLKLQKAGLLKLQFLSKPLSTILEKTRPGAWVSPALSPETSKPIPGPGQWNPICGSLNSVPLQDWI